MTKKYVMTIDQGTTSSRALLFDDSLTVKAMAQQEIPQYYPHSGWVEHDPEIIWQSVLMSCKQVMAQANVEAHDIVAIGITNQRETSLIWDRTTGNALYPAIVWQDRRTAEYCAQLKAAGYEKEINTITGLLLDPYFSATKIAWILDQQDGAREAAKAGRLAFGTIDSFLLWRLTGGKCHKTDATNASRTMLYDIRHGRWQQSLLDLLHIPASLLPEVQDCAAHFGMTIPHLFGAAIPITGIAGDQQAAMIGQACFTPGMMKSTYGTGCFSLLNTGEQPVFSNNRLLTTIAYQLQGKPVYALEGSIFIAGAAVQWLRDGLQIIDTAAESGILAAESNPEAEIYLVPAFVGLGAPYWDSECRGAIYGITRDTGRAEFAKAALESVCFQTCDLRAAMQRDWQVKDTESNILRVDGGMVASDWTLQRLADLLDSKIDRPNLLETTALGAAYLAGMQIGFYPEPDTYAKSWSLDRRFTPKMTEEERMRKRAGWQEAVQRTLTS